MRLVKQTIFGDQVGNCLAACLASILDIEIDEVPEIPKECSEEFKWLKLLNSWLGMFFGYYLLFMESSDWFGRISESFIFTRGVVIPNDEIIIAFGKSKNFPGQQHAVLWKGGKLLFDPSPLEKQGLDSAPNAYLMLCKSIKEK